jgi:hypothetical protein
LRATSTVDVWEEPLRRNHEALSKQPPNNAFMLMLSCWFSMQAQASSAGTIEREWRSS